MHRRRTQDYEKMLDILIKESKALGKPLETKVIMTDFEKAPKVAFKNNFKSIESYKGCLFHFAQAIYRKWKSLGLHTAFKDNETVSNWLRSIFALALIPMEFVSLEYCQILTTNQKKHSVAY